MTYFETTFSGEISASNGTVASCPRCGSSTGLTIHGNTGSAAQFRCRSGHNFSPSRDFDAVRLLTDAVNDPRRIRTR